MQSILIDFISKYMPLTSQEKDAILALNLIHCLKKGTVLLKEGQYSSDGYFVIKGS